MRQVSDRMLPLRPKEISALASILMEKAVTRFRESCDRHLFLQRNGMYLSLAHNLKLVKPLAEGTPVTWNDVECDHETAALRLRREIEQLIT